MVKEKDIVRITAMALAACLGVSEVAKVAENGVTASLKNSLLTLMFGGVVIRVGV